MRKLSIVLLLISISFMTMEANNLSKHRRKIIRWTHAQRAPVSIPIDATLDESTIEVHFLENVDKQVIFQVKDLQGNIIFQDMIATPIEQGIYKIDLEGFKVGHYELLYIEEDTTFIGKFSIEL